MSDNSMNLYLVAFESMGVRSQATFIQTKSTTIFIDPSAALAPRRFGLPPHVSEVKRLLDVFDKITDFVKDSEIIIITHYHYDHHDPGRFLDPEIYKGKTIYIKDPENNINVSQRIRASTFLKIISDKTRNIVVADGKCIKIEETTICFSHPLPHGEENKLGYVISVCIEDNDTSFLYTSDIEGGSSRNHKSLTNFCKANIAIVDGPPTYLLGYKYSFTGFKTSLEFLNNLIQLKQLEHIVLDHHVCRDLDYMNKIIDIITESRNKNKKIATAAQFMGLEPMFLEARRKELFDLDPTNGLNLLISRYRNKMINNEDAHLFILGDE